MWPLSRKAAPAAELTTPGSTSWQALLGWFTATAAGVTVTPQSAFRVPAVNCAVRAISETVGSLPVEVYRRLDANAREVDPAHPAWPLVHDDANDWASAGEVRRQVTQDALLYGEGFALVTRVNGAPAEIVRLDRSAVSVACDTTTGEPSYKVGGEPRDAGDVICIRCPALDGCNPVSPIVAGRDAIGLAIVLEQHAAKLFRNSARPGGVLSLKSRLNAEAAQRISESWRAAHGGDSQGGVAVLDGDASFAPIGFSSVDAQFAEMRAFAIAEIARLFRVPPIMLQNYDRATWSNGETMGRLFLQYTLLPWIDQWTAAYRRTLLGKDERKTYEIAFDTDWLLQGDTAARGAFYSQMRAAGVLTANDVREREGWRPLPDGDTLQNPFTSSGAAAPAKEAA